MIELRNLGSFVALAEELNFTRAAARLGISQPTLTYRIRRLEEEVGAVLIERRSRRNWQLTEAGEHLFAEVSAGVRRLENALEGVRRFASGQAGELHVGVVPFAPPVLVTKAIETFQRDAPGVTVSIRELTLHDQFAETRNGSVDLGLVPTRPDGPDLWAEPVLHDPLVAALPSDHDLAAEGAVSLSALRRNDFLVVGRGGNSPSRQALFTRCQGNGFTPRVAAEGPLTTMLQLVQAGEGVTLLPRSAAPAPTPNGMVFVPLRDGHIELFAVSNPARQNLGSVRFIKALLDAGRQLAELEPRAIGA